MPTALTACLGADIARNFGLDCATEGEYTRRPARRGILARTRSTLPCTDGAISDSGRLISANPAFRRIWEIERNAVDVALEEYNVLEDE